MRISPRPSTTASRRVCIVPPRSRAAATLPFSVASHRRSVPTAPSRLRVRSAFRSGAVPEIIEDGLTGAIVDTMEEAILALPLVIALDRKKVRQRFEQRFSATRMARDYVGVYHSLLASSESLGGDERDIQHLLPDGRYANNLRPHVA